MRATASWSSVARPAASGPPGRQRDRPLGTKQPVETDRPEQLSPLVHHIELEETLGRSTVSRMWSMRRPVHDGGTRDELRSASPAGGFFWIMQDASTAPRSAAGICWRFRPALLRQVFKMSPRRRNRGRAHSATVWAGRSSRSLRDGILNLGERREVELAAEQFDKAAGAIRIERHRSGRGSIHACSPTSACKAVVAAFDGLPHVVEDSSADPAVVVAEGGSPAVRHVS